MTYQKLLWQTMPLIILQLVGCDAQKTTSNLPTPTPSRSASTPVPPTATPAPMKLMPSGDLSVAAKLVLGPAQVTVIKVAESTTTPLLQKPAQSGMKFILVEFRINKLKAGGELSTARLFLEGSSGKQYGTPIIYVESSGMEGEAGASLTATAPGGTVGCAQWRCASHQGDLSQESRY